MEKKVVPEVGDNVNCRRLIPNTDPPEYEWRQCQIVNIRERHPQYSVHFLKLNRRWDAWVDIESFDLTTITKNTTAKKKKGHTMTAEEQAERDREFLGKTRNIEYLRLAHFQMKCWYYSPVPAPFDNEILYCCEFCMRFFKTEKEYNDHYHRCQITHPPGDEIYRSGRVSAYEVDGQFAMRYCTNLCLITKLFLDHKSQYYDPRMFYFYIVCINDLRGAHPVGFFSKDKNSEQNYHLACIVTFPCYQRMGIGRFLIELSYELTKIERKPGSPEKPLSDLGLLSFAGYWKDTVLQYILEHKDDAISISKISQETGMTEDDIKYAILDGHYLKYIDGEWVFALTFKQIEDWKAKSRKRVMKLDPRCLRWSPYPHVRKPE